MPKTSRGAKSGPPATPTSPDPEFQEFLVRRDNDRPLSFTGIRLAHAVRQSSSGLLVTAAISKGVETLEAAVYKTRGGKYVTTLVKGRRTSVIAQMTGDPVDIEATDNFGYRKAEVHDSFDAAVAWFRPGRLTDEIREQLGLDEPERID